MQEEGRAAALLLHTGFSVLHLSDHFNWKIIGTELVHGTQWPEWQDLRLRRSFSHS